MGADEAQPIGVPTSYGDTGTTESFCLPVSPKHYTPPNGLMVMDPDETLNLQMTQENMRVFIDEVAATLDAGNADVMSLAKTFFPSLQITTANWQGFGKQFPELKRSVETLTFKIATLILSHVGENDSQAQFTAARFLATIVIYKNYGINRGQLYTASRLASFAAPMTGESSKGRMLYEKLLLSLKYAVDKRDDDPLAGQGRGGYYDVESNSSIIRASAGADKVVDENSEASLDARDSYSSIGAIQNYQWEQISGPKVKWISGANVVMPHFTTPTVFKEQKLGFKLTVTDSIGDPYEDTVVYTVVNNINESPQVKIRGPKEILAGEKITLEATGYDDNEDALNFDWQETTRHGVPIRTQSSTEPNQSRVTLTAPLVTGRSQNVTLRVTINDGYGTENNGQAVKEWTVKVLPLPSAPTSPAVVVEVKPEIITKPAQPPATKPSVTPVKPITSSTERTSPTPSKPAPRAKVEAVADSQQASKAQSDPTLPPLPSDINLVDAPDNGVVTTIVNLHAVDPKKPNNRILILIDVSGSMGPAAGELAAHADALVSKALERTVDGGFFELALGYYLDGKTKIIMPFTRIEKTMTPQAAESATLLKEQLRTKADYIAKVVMTMPGQGQETLWYSVYEVISGSHRLNWKDSAVDTNQTIIALTDAEAMTEAHVYKKWDEAAAFELAATEDVELKPVLLSNAGQQEENKLLAKSISVLTNRDATVAEKTEAAQNLEKASRQDLEPHLVVFYDNYGNDNDAVRVAILRALNPKNKTANDFLRKIMDDKENSLIVRQMALAKLIGSKQPGESLTVAAFVILDKEEKEAVASLEQMIRNRDSSTLIRQQAINALVAIYSPSSEIEQIMLSVVDNRDYGYDMQQRLTAIRYLLKNSSSVDGTIYAAILNNKVEHKIIRLQMIELLAKIDTPLSAWALNQAMLDEKNSTDIRQAAAAALKELKKTSIATQVYLAVLNQENPILNADEKEIELAPFIKVVEDENSGMSMRMDMIDVLQAVGGQKAVAALLKQMQDSNSSTNVRQKSARALGEFNQPEVVSQLVIVFGKKSSDPYLRKAAGESLVQLGSRDAIEPAMQILKEENSPEVIPVAIQIVAMSNDPRAVALIKKVWRQHRDDDSIRAAAEVALAQM